MPDSPTPRTLDRQIAVVTGAGAGIARACAEALAAAGAALIIDYRPAENFRREAMEVVAAIQDMTLADWRRVLDVKLTGHFLRARQAVRHFLSRQAAHAAKGAPGEIIFMSSVHVVIPWAFQPNYAAFKGGAMLLTKSLGQKVASMKIRVNAMAPGAIRTKINKETWNTENSRPNGSNSFRTAVLANLTISPPRRSGWGRRRLRQRHNAICRRRHDALSQVSRCGLFVRYLNPFYISRLSICLSVWKSMV